jgi:uncharacterized cysteine cluster protein YcgN (CxxCxxCC family)
VTTESAFWQQPLASLSREQWEKLCDGCARCCLVKLEDEESGEIHYTSIVCRYLDRETCRCSEYKERTRLVPDCLQVTPDNLVQLHWMPSSCAYRLLAEGHPLPEWHPLIAGNREAIREEGISACNFAISETEIGSEDDLEEYLID